MAIGNLLSVIEHNCMHQSSLENLEWVKRGGGATKVYHHASHDFKSFTDFTHKQNVPARYFLPSGLHTVAPVVNVSGPPRVPRALEVL